MGRLVRLVVPEVPHHVTQRGNRRQATFFQDSDYRLYLTLLAEECARCAVQLWAYCLMPNHTHLLPVPASAAGLALAIGETHRRYTTLINGRQHWTGHLWQGRFYSYPLEGTHLLNAVRYIECNPVRAGLVELPWLYPWSSAAFRLGLRDDLLVARDPLQSMVDDWRAFLAVDLAETELARFRQHTRTGRQLLPQKRGRPRREGA